MNKINFKRTPYSFKNYLGYKRVCKIIKEKRFDTIFCHEPVGGAVGRLAGHKTKCKVIYMAHGFHFYKGAPKSRVFYYWIEKWLSKYTDVLITINNEDYNASLKMKAKKCLKVNGVGVDIKKYVSSKNDLLRNELGLNDDDFLLLSVGELIKRKNHLSVLKALLKTKNTKVHYAIAGEGEIKKSLVHFAKKNNLTDNVHFLGYRNNINDICNSTDIFVMPSIHEGLSVALMEAMACGLPIIASEIRGNVDLLEGSSGCRLVKTFDVEGYAEAIDKMCGMGKERLAECGQENKVKIQSYDLSLVIPIIANVLED